VDPQSKCKKTEQWTDRRTLGNKQQFTTMYATLKNYTTQYIHLYSPEAAA